jgi:hypothetical protein
MCIRYRSLAVSAALLFIAGCGSNTTPAADAPADGKPVTVPKAEMTVKGPVGVWFMVRYVNHSLEKAAWYFSADGVAYENPDEGLTPEALAAHKGRKGKFTWTGKAMEVDFGKEKVKAEVEQDKTGFMWDMGSFTPAAPYTDAKLAAGKYEGGESLSHGGNAVAVAREIELKADGTYEYSAISALKADTKQSTGRASAGGSESGTWTLDGFIMTMTAGGKTTRKIAFPYDDGESKRLYLGGTMYKLMKKK